MEMVISNEAVVVSVAVSAYAFYADLAFAVPSLGSRYLGLLKWFLETLIPFMEMVI